MQLEPSFPPGTEIAGKYVVERRLGAGGMGVVLAVRHKELGERYALKLMLPAASASDPARERFAREAKAAARLKSEHVARAIDFGFLSDGGAPFMVLELLEGQNLAERLSERGPLEPREIARLMLDACDALREAHAEGIVHRDLKPANLFCTPRRDGTTVLKVLDFGIAKTLAQDSAALTKTATTMGSPFYMSPEQMRSAKSADARSDVWSLGVTMFELATGHLPFVGETVTEVAILVIEAAVPSPTIYVPDLPPPFVQIVLRCLQKDPARRHADVEDLAEELAAFVGETWTRTSPKRVVSIVPGGASTDPSVAFAKTESPEVAPPPTVAAEPLVTSPSLSPPPRRRSAALLAAGVVGVGVVATGGYLLASSPTQVRVGGGVEVSDVVTNAPTLAETAVTASVAYVSSSAPTTPLPTRTRDDLMRALGGAKGSLEQCYQRASVVTRTKTNELEFVLKIAPNGSLATNPTIKGDDFEQIDLDCFVAALRRVSFPPGTAQDELDDKIVVGRKPSAGGASIGGVGAGDFVVQRPLEETSNVGPRPKGEYGLPLQTKKPRAPAGD
jgi:serine/threonine protein kinase